MSDMPALFENRYAPVTHGMGFVEGEVERVSSTYLAWQREIGIEVSGTVIESGFENQLLQLLPLSMPRRRALFCGTDSGWTAYLDNGINGPDPLPPISQLCERLRCRGVTIACIPHKLASDVCDQRGTYGAVQFQLLDGHSDAFLKIVRSISVAYDARWRFDQAGDVLPFEIPSRYKLKSIVDRFTPDMLADYCRALGIRPFDDSFFKGRAVLIARQTGFQGTSRELSLSEARAEIGLSCS